MRKNPEFSLITRPGAGIFFTWIALSAAIFFGAYSVRIQQMYQAEVTKNNEVQRRERELSYRLDMAAVKIKDSTETIKWSNLQIEQLRKRNDDILEKSANLRKLLYTAIKKQQNADSSVQVSAVEPKLSSDNPGVTGERTSRMPLPEELLFSELSGNTEENEARIAEMVQRSEELKDDSNAVVAEVLTYNPGSRKVFINLGKSNSAVNEGNRFAIWRNGKHVTDVRVAQVHAVTSTCEIISPVFDSVCSGDTAEFINISAY